MVSTYETTTTEVKLQTWVTTSQAINVLPLCSNYWSSANCRASENRRCEAKVGDFDDVVLTDETVACGEIAVDEAFLLKVFHRRADLQAHVDKLACLLYYQVLASSQEGKHCAW